MATKKKIVEKIKRAQSREFLKSQGVKAGKEYRNMTAAEKKAYIKKAAKFGGKLALEGALSATGIGAAGKVAAGLAGKAAAKKLGGKFGAGVGKKIKKFVKDTAPSRKGPKGKTKLSPKSGPKKKNFPKTDKEIGEMKKRLPRESTRKKTTITKKPKRADIANYPRSVSKKKLVRLGKKKSDPFIEHIRKITKETMLKKKPKRRKK